MKLPTTFIQIPGQTYCHTVDDGLIECSEHPASRVHHEVLTPPITIDVCDNCKTARAKKPSVKIDSDDAVECPEGMAPCPSCAEPCCISSIACPACGFPRPHTSN